MPNKEKAPTREEMDKLQEFFNDKTPPGVTLPMGSEGMKKIMKQLKKIRGMEDGGLAQAIEKVKAKGMDIGGEAKKVKPREERDIPKPKMRPESLKADKTVIINEDFSKRVAKTNKEAMKKAKKMEAGGKAVPPKFKGFSKLPESVQQQMNPDLAEKFGMGGDVKSKKGKNICRGRGIARKGTGFTLR